MSFRLCVFALLAFTQISFAQIIQESEFPKERISIQRADFKVVDKLESNTQTIEVELSNLEKRSLPFGSVVKHVESEMKAVLSVAYKNDIESRQIKLPSALAEVQDVIALKQSDLKDVKDYVLLLDQEDLNLKFSLNSKGKIQGFSKFIIFDVVDLKVLESGKLKVLKRIALNVEDHEAFKSAVAVLEKGVVRDIQHEARQHSPRSESVGFNFFRNLKSKVAKSSTGIGSVEDVVCSLSGKAQILSSDLSQKLATLNNGERVRLVQGFSNQPQHKGFVEVGYGNNHRGFISAAELRPKSACAQKMIIQNDQSVAQAETAETAEAPPEALATPSGKFPTIARGSVSYRSGMRAFGANRGGGTRLHAACDIYRVKNEKTVAVEAGKVIRGPYYFYEGTYAKEVKLNSGPVIRYGEITASNSGAATGAFKTGAVIGYIGKTYCCTPMLHFEKFAGTKSGSLSGGGKYKRRSDLQNPTSYLQRLEKSTFGVSY